jgi:pyruvate formate lyase activating enzyme
VVFTSGCNFVCPYCHNPDLAAGPVTGDGSQYDPDAIFAFLEKRKGLVEGVAITGGEPTLQPDLGLFCRKIREMGYKIKLDSNGTRPKVLASLLKDRLIDYIAMDIKTSLSQYPTIAKGKLDAGKIQDSIHLIMEKAPAYEFRTTCVKPFITPEIMEQIARMLNSASRYVLQKCSRNVTVLDPDFLKQDHHFFTPEQMIHLKSIARAHIPEVILR